MSTTEQNNSLNHISLQKNLIYLLHRPTEAKKLVLSIEKSILAQNLTSEEISWLKNIDERRWSIDHERPYRTIEGALFHCPVSAIALSSLFYKIRQTYTKEDNILKFLSKYFKSDEFLFCIRDGQHIVDTLLLWLNKQIKALSLPKKFSKDRSIFLQLSALELDLIKARRSRVNSLNTQTSLVSEIRSDSRLNLPKSVYLFSGSIGLSESFILLNQKAIKLSDQQGRSSLLLAKINLQNLPIDLNSACTIMIQKNHQNHESVALDQAQKNEQDCSIESLPDHLAEVLRFVQSQPTYEELKTFMLSYDLEADEVFDLVQEWIESNLISLDS